MPNSIIPGTEQYDQFGNLISAEMETPSGRQRVADQFTLSLATKAAPAPGALPPEMNPPLNAPAPPSLVGPPAPSIPPVQTGASLPNINAAAERSIGVTPPAPLTDVQTSGSQLGTPSAQPAITEPAVPSSGGQSFTKLREEQESFKTYDPTLEAEQREIINRGKDALKAGYEAELAMSKVASQTAEQESQILQTQIDADNARKDAQRQQAEAYKRQADEALSRYEGMELEPGRVWANASTGDRMLAGLSMLLGAWGATMTGDKTNPAIAAIEKIMDKDLEVQKAAIAKGKDVAGAHSSAYRDLLAAHRDEDAAAAAVRELAWKGLASRARAAEAKAKDPAIRAKYQAGIVELDAKANEEAMKRSERSQVIASKQVPLATAGSNIKFNDDIVEAGRGQKITIAKNVHDKADHILRWAQKLSPKQREEMFGLIDNKANEIARELGLKRDKDYIEGKVSREMLKKMALFRLSGAGVPVAEDVKFDNILPNFSNYDNFVNGMADFRDQMADEYNNEINNAVSSAAHPERKRMIQTAFPLLNTKRQTEALKDKYRTK